MREELLLDVSHRRVVFSIPGMLRIFFKYNRRLLRDFCKRINLHPHLYFLVTEGGVDEACVFYKVSRFDDSRLAELFSREVLSNLVARELISPEWAGRLLSWRHTGFLVRFSLRMVEEELRPIPAKRWAEMIRKVYEVDPMVCRRCGATMKVIAFLIDYAVVDRIINHLRLSFVADRPPPPHIAYQEVLIDVEAWPEYFS